MKLKSILTTLPLFAISSSWAADTLRVSVNNTVLKSYTLIEIVKVVPTMDSLILHSAEVGAMQLLLQVKSGFLPQQIFSLVQK
jgi:hypothetical protein